MGHKTDIIVYCAKGYGEQIYLKLLNEGGHVIAFCDNAKDNEGGMRLGLPIYCYQECRQRYPNAIYVVANSTYGTAVEIGAELERDGYRKDSTYYFSLELEEQGKLVEYKQAVPRVLENQVLILYGRQFLCDLFVKWTEVLEQSMMVYICPTEDAIDEFARKWPDAIWIPLEMGISLLRPVKNAYLVQVLQKHGIRSFTRFFLENMLYCEQLPLSENRDTDFSERYNIQVEKVLFLTSSSLSGSMLIDTILDSHPNVLTLGMNIWGWNIWHIIKKVVDFSGEDLSIAIINEMEFYLRTIDAEEKYIKWLKKYQAILNRYFSKNTFYSERDLFLIIHLAYYESVHGKPLQGEAIIYMDIHSNVLMEDSVLTWLGDMGFAVTLLEMIRTPFKRLGSHMKLLLYSLNEPCETLYASNVFNLLYEMSGEMLCEKGKLYPLIRIRFEDLKMYPRKILKRLCDVLKLPWSDTLLETTQDGEESVYAINGDRVTGFDLKPVYYTYDEYFDAFDKFRLDLLFREKSKAYGYSYVERDKYPASLEELGRLFELPFSFERFIPFAEEFERKKYRKKLGILCTWLLEMEDEREKYAAHFQFGDYLTVEETK